MHKLLWLTLWAVLLLFGCSGRQIRNRATRVARTGGGAVALSRDERIAVVTNRSAGIVTVYSLASINGEIQAKIVGDFDTGADSEPWAAVVGLDDDTAYVLFRNAQIVRRVTSLHGKPVLQDGGVSVGSEPSAIAISPSGKKLFVANWGEGTVSVITTQDLVSRARIDLNSALVKTGVLGAGWGTDAGARFQPRLSLAHPRALAITDNGDDNDFDETLYATEFFSQPLPGVPPASDHSDVDQNRQGFVYPVSLATGLVGKAIAIAPVPATGFLDSNGSMTSCFPNQLYAAAVNNGRLYVTSMCTSPRGPIGPATAGPVDRNFKTLFHPAVFVIDTATNEELPRQGRLLTQILDGYYQSGEDATDERMPLIPNDIAFADSAAGSKAYMSALGADALFRLDYDAAGNLQQIGDPGARHIDVNSKHGLPIGVAISKLTSPPFALVATDTKLRLSVIDRTTEQVTSFADVSSDSNAPPVAARAAAYRLSDAGQGRAFFGTGLDNWSYKGQAWSSCESCHPGGLSDGVTWFFARGPRRTISTAGTYDKTTDVAARSQRMLLWGANIDEVHDIEAIVRRVSGGVGAALWSYATTSATNDCRLLYDGTEPTAEGQNPSCPSPAPTTDLDNGLNGSLSNLEMRTPCMAGAPACDAIGPDWHTIDSFIRGLRAPRSPTKCAGSETDNCLPATDIAAGRALFEEGGCAGCHGGPGWTISKRFYTPGPGLNGALPYDSTLASLPLQLGTLRTSSYSVPSELLALNPAAWVGKNSSAFRNLPPPGLTDAETIAYFYSAANAQDDQLLCTLRDVGTFPDQTTATFTGITPAGAPGVVEVRQDMKSLAQGQTGFNVPSLFGLSLGAPYFHAGNARTLEELFDDAFLRHHTALAPTFLGDSTQRDAQVALLISFLLSVDESSTLEEPVTADEPKTALDFCGRAGGTPEPSPNGTAGSGDAGGGPGGSAQENAADDAGAGGAPPAPRAGPGEPCKLSTDCSWPAGQSVRPFDCLGGLCHSQCFVSTDCPQPERCVDTPTGAICLLPAEMGCAVNADCVLSLTCAPDRKCRNACDGDLTCMPGRCCSSGFCIDPLEHYFSDANGSNCLTPTACRAGVVTCNGTNGATCSAAGPLPDGTPCGTGFACYDGTCVPH